MSIPIEKTRRKRSPSFLLSLWPNIILISLKRHSSCPNRKHSKQEGLVLTIGRFIWNIKWNHKSQYLKKCRNNNSSLWKIHFCPNFLCPHLGCLCFHHSFLHDDYVVDTFIHHKKNKKAIPRVKKQQFVGAFTRSIIFTARKCKEFAISLLFGVRCRNERCYSG